MPQYKTSDGKWRYRFSHNKARYGGHATTQDNTKRAAAELERRHLAKLSAGKYTGAMPTVAEFAVRFLEFQQVNTKQLTHELHTRIITLHVLPHLGKRPLDQVRKAELDGLKTTWDCAPRTKNTRLGVVMRMLAIAEEWEILDKAPLVKLIKVPKDVPRFLTEDEAAALIEASKYRGRKSDLEWHSMVLVGLRTGLRIGELRGLQWGDIDFDQAAIMVRRTDPGRGDMEPNAPKGNRPRLVPLTPDSLAVITSIRHDGKWVWPGATSWHDQRGRLTTRSEGNCARAIGAIAARASLDEDVTWHTLRHTYASWLVMRGVSLAVVQELLGHASIRQTEHYAHLSPGFAQHAAVASLDIPLVSVHRFGSHTQAKALTSGRKKPNDDQ